MPMYDHEDRRPNRLLIEVVAVAGLFLLLLLAVTEPTPEPTDPAALPIEELSLEQKVERLRERVEALEAVHGE